MIKKFWLYFVGKFQDWIDPLSKLAQVFAVVIAGFWTYHLHLITGEYELKPVVSVSAQVIDYKKEARLVAVHVIEKNNGKVPIELNKDALTVTIKKIPESQPFGYVDVDKQPMLYENKDFLQRYGDGVEVDPGVEFEEVELFSLPRGLYRIEATVALPNSDDLVNGFAVLEVK